MLRYYLRRDEPLPSTVFPGDNWKLWPAPPPPTLGSSRALGFTVSGQSQAKLLHCTRTHPSPPPGLVGMGTAAEVGTGSSLQTEGPQGPSQSW